MTFRQWSHDQAQSLASQYIIYLTYNVCYNVTTMVIQTRLQNRDYSDMQSLMLPNYILQLRFWNRRSKGLPLQPSPRLLLVGECKGDQLELAECRAHK